MARRFFYEFRTLLGKYVTVNIFDRDFTGTAIELDKDVPNSPGMPTDNPVVIEEDDSTNMLDVIRTKTGYINIVTDNINLVRNIIPMTGATRKVVALEWDENEAEWVEIFFGWVQPQLIDIDICQME